MPNSEALELLAHVLYRTYPQIKKLTRGEATAVYLYTVEGFLPGTSQSRRQQLRNVAVMKIGVSVQELRNTLVREYWREVGRREHGCGTVATGAGTPRGIVTRNNGRGRVIGPDDATGSAGRL